MNEWICRRRRVCACLSHRCIEFKPLKPRIILTTPRTRCRLSHAKFLAKFERHIIPIRGANAGRIGYKYSLSANTDGPHDAVSSKIDHITLYADYNHQTMIIKCSFLLVFYSRPIADISRLGAKFHFFCDRPIILIFLRRIRYHTIHMIIKPGSPNF